MSSRYFDDEELRVPVYRAMIVAVVLGLGLSGCQTDLELTEEDFRCQTDADCADGFECVDVPDEPNARECKKPGEGFAPRDTGDEADSDTTQPPVDADLDAEPDTEDVAEDVESNPDALPHAANELIVTSGQDFSCAFRAAGDAYCWGRNQEGQLGTGETSDDPEFAPVPVEMPGTKFISTPKSVDSKHRGTCAIGIDRAVYCWGRNNGGIADPDGLFQLVTSPTRVEFSDPTLRFDQVEVGFDHACARTRSDELYCWGANSQGQLGIGGGQVDHPERVDEAAFEEAEKFIMIAAGLEFTCALTNAEDVYCWGAYDTGRLGGGEDSATQDVDTPQRINSGAWAGGQETVSGLTAYTGTACMRVEGGNAYCWGRNDTSQVGSGSTDNSDHYEPSAVAGGFSFEAVYAGEHHTCGITNDNRARCWGANDDSQLGLEEPGPVFQPGEPIRQTMSAEKLRFRHLAPGVGHTCGVTDDHEPRIFCWGDNAVGQLGNSSVSDHSPVPRQVELP